jgi:hypothetical protein
MNLVTKGYPLFCKSSLGRLWFEFWNKCMTMMESMHWRYSKGKHTERREMKWYGGELAMPRDVWLAGEQKAWLQFSYLYFSFHITNSVTSGEEDWWFI